MGLQDRIRRLESKLPARRKTLVLEFGDPQTGEYWLRMVIPPLADDGSSGEVEEVWTPPRDSPPQ